jgi:hypothetical protein
MMKEIVWRGTADPDPGRAGSVTDPDSRRRRACFTTKRSHHQDSSALLTDRNDYSIVRAFLDYQVRVSEHFIAHVGEDDARPICIARHTNSA